MKSKLTLYNKIVFIFARGKKGWIFRKC